MYTSFGGIEKDIQQQIFILIKKDSPLVKNAREHEAAMEYLRTPWKFDVDGDYNLKEYKYTRRPVIVEADIEIEGKLYPTFFISLHTKSKYVVQGQSLWESGNPNLQMTYIKKAIKCRRRIGSECNRTRQMIDNVLLSENPDAFILVAGDMNDGPGFDFFETYYLLFDSVEKLMGSPFNNTKLLRASILEHTELPEELLYSCVFDDFIDKVKNKRCLVDHVFTTPTLDRLVSHCGVMHDLWGRHSVETADRFERLSDHRPVYCDFISYISPVITNPINTANITIPTESHITKIKVDLEPNIENKGDDLVANTTTTDEVSNVTDEVSNVTNEVPNNEQ